jgi:hypothetical protein
MRLVGEDSNAFSIMGRASKALRKAGASQADIKQYMDEATSGDYNNLLRVTMEWVNTDEDEDE